MTQTISSSYNRAARAALASLLVVSLGGAFLSACNDEDEPTDGTAGSGGLGGSADHDHDHNHGGAPPVAPSCDVPEGLGGFGGADGGEPIAIAGSYTDDFGGSHTITPDSWVSGFAGVFHFTAVDSDEGFAVALNAEDNAYSACAYSRFSWVFEAGELYYCQAPYDAATEAAALADTSADETDLETGCGGFPWSKLTPVE
jgi:hypothetical protein